MQAPVGELRQDILTNDWVVVATGRAKRPDQFAVSAAIPLTENSYVETCPFCNEHSFPQEKTTLRLPDDDHDWQIKIFGNKFPAFIPKEEFKTWHKGPYRTIEAVGYHEILIPKKHNLYEHVASAKELSLTFEALGLRYRELKTKPSVNYIQIIKNHGPEAGGSIEHPHHQILTVPVLPKEVAQILNTSEAYAKKHNKSIFKEIFDFEKESGERIVCENEHFLAYCPYASKMPFETWIIPKHIQPYFEYISAEERDSLAEIMQKIIRKLYKGLNNPPYNYYIHSAPCDDTGFTCDLSTFQHFCWHIELLPRLTKFGGFELGTGLEITTALPEESAKFLRELTI